MYQKAVTTQGCRVPFEVFCAQAAGSGVNSRPIEAVTLRSSITGQDEGQVDQMHQKSKGEKFCDKVRAVS